MRQGRGRAAKEATTTWPSIPGKGKGASEYPDKHVPTTLAEMAEILTEEDRLASLAREQLIGAHNIAKAPRHIAANNRPATC